MFLPRRASPEQYNEKTDERKGTNVILLADEDFENVEVCDLSNRCLFFSTSSCSGAWCR